MDLTFSWDQLFTNELQFIGFVSGILSVLLLLFTKQPKLQYLAWPAGVINAIAYFFIFMDWQLYGSTWLQPYFLVTTLLGTVLWRGQLVGRPVARVSNRWLAYLSGDASIPTTHARPREFFVVGAAALLVTVPVYFVLRSLQDTSPLWDGLILTLSAAAIIFQLRKQVQTWFLWIAVDCISIPLYASQGNGGTAVLYALFMVMCFFGLFSWRDAARERVRNLTPSSGGQLKETMEHYGYLRDHYSHA